MRLAVLIVSLVAMLIMGIQSVAVAIGGSLSESLSRNAAEKETGHNLAGAGGVGIFAALLWLVGAAFVMAKPKVSVWLFGVAAFFCVVGGAAGFTDLFVYAGLSVLFALGSWRGINEQRRKDAQEQARYQADVAIAAAHQQNHWAQVGPGVHAVEQPYAYENQVPAHSFPVAPEQPQAAAGDTPPSGFPVLSSGSAGRELP